MMLSRSNTSQSLANKELSAASPKVLCGFLSKQGQLFTKLRWCVLRGKILFVFKSVYEKHPSETIDTSMCSFEPLERKTGRFMFSLRPLFDPGRTHLFLVSFEERYEAWCNALASNSKPPNSTMSVGEESKLWNFLGQSQTFVFFTPDSVDPLPQNRWDVSYLLETAQRQGFLIAGGKNVIKRWKLRWIAINGIYLLQMKNPKSDTLSVALSMELITRDEIEILSDAEISQHQLPTTYAAGNGESSGSAVVLGSSKVYWFAIRSAVLRKSFFYGSLSASERSEWIDFLKETVRRSPIALPPSYDTVSHISREFVSTEVSTIDEVGTPGSKGKDGVSLGSSKGSWKKGFALAKYKMKPIVHSEYESTISTIDSEGSSESTLGDFSVDPQRNSVDFDLIQATPKYRFSQILPEGHSALLNEENGNIKNIQISDIEFRGKIGRGASGKVYFGLYHGQKVAIKKLFMRKMTRKDLENFRLEVEVCSKLHHPNIVKLVGSCTEPPNLLLIMEFISRGNLSTMLYNISNPMPWELRLKMLHQAAHAMEFVHSKNVLHRDLKSANLLVTDDYNIKISDFGVSRYFNSEALSMTQIGSPCWMAPEVIRSEPYGRPADIYSFAIVIWEVCYRRIPYENLNAMQISYKVAMENFRPSVPPVSNRLSYALSSPLTQFEDEDELVCLPDDIAIEPKTEHATRSDVVVSHLPKPPSDPQDAPTELLDFMKTCWASNPLERPTFSDVVMKLKELIESHVA